jgi:hypothetical protein
MWVTLLAGALVLAVMTVPWAIQAQTSPAPNICTTQYGWCPIRPDFRFTHGAACFCFVPPNTQLPGRLIFYAYWEHHPGPVSPYLNPHSTAAPNLR